MDRESTPSLRGDFLHEGDAGKQRLPGLDDGAGTPKAGVRPAGRWATLGDPETRHLAALQRVSKPSIVSAVDTLEKRGLVRRARNDADRRLVAVELTDGGARKIEEAQRTFHACEREIVGVLSAREQRSLARMLRKLEGSAREIVKRNANRRA